MHRIDIGYSVAIVSDGVSAGPSEDTFLSTVAAYRWPLDSKQDVGRRA